MDTQSRSIHQPRKEALSLGFLLALTGVSLNKWSVERVLVPDEHIASTGYVATIVTFQSLLLFLGLWLLLGRRAPFLPGVVRKMLIPGLVAGVLLGFYGNLKALGIIDPNRELRAAWDAVVTSEEVIMSLEKEVQKLTSSLMNLHLPDHLSRELFADTVFLTDLTGGLPALSEEFPPIRVGVRNWPAESQTPQASRENCKLWRPLLEGVRYFKAAKFYNIRGRFLNERRDEYESDLGFQGLARMESGKWLSIKAQQKVAWKTAGEATEPAKATWRIYDWRTEKFQTMETERLLFSEVLDAALGPADLHRARRSVHEEMVLKSLVDKDNFEKPNPWFYLAAVDRHPGLSVVDVDRDGFDDLYVMERETRNMLFRNRGDGTFEEIASQLGLDVQDFTASAIFADFDNDGDTDAFLGRTLAPSMYLVNENGRFNDRSATLIDGGPPYLVSSVSAVDYNGDGLLDVYFSTYAAQMINASERSIREVFSAYLSKEDVAELERLLRGMGNKIMNFPGPPNVLLKNVGGGRFTVATESPELRVFRNTYQATWADFDDDGDPDVYLGNDFGPNNLFRNDGNGKFLDVTAETRTADIGFGMGAAWGDYDNDGKQDLYVSNMFSKAGQRITEQVPTLDPRFRQMARGNSLFRNTSGLFEKVSGTASPALTVEVAGWSWGGQFFDVDNDGFQDIHALSGHYSAPKSVDAGVDI